MSSKQPPTRFFLPVSFPYASLMGNDFIKSYLMTFSFHADNTIALHVDDYLVCEVDGLYPFSSNSTTIVIGTASSRITQTGSSALSASCLTDSGIVIASFMLSTEVLSQQVLSLLSVAGPFYSLHQTFPAVLDFMKQPSFSFSPLAVIDCSVMTVWSMMNHSLG